MKINPHTGGNCALTSSERPLRTETFSLMSQLPGFKRWDGYTLIFRPTVANVKFVRDNWPAAQWLKGTASHLEQIAVAEKEAARTIGMKTERLPAASKDRYQYKRKPREHQRRALLMSWDKKAFALLMEQRTGKTKVIIDNAAHLFSLKRLHTLIIVTLNGVHRNWVDNEVPADMPDNCPYEAYFQRGAHTARQQMKFETVLGAKDKLRIFAFNVEALSRDGRARDLFEMAMGTGAGVMLVVDESADCIKNYAAKRTRYIIKFGGKAEYRRILTGTQAPEGRPDELFPQYKFLGDDILGYDTITTYRAHFCNLHSLNLTDRKVTVVAPGCRNLEELQALIDPHSFRIRRAECLDLPPKVYKRWPVELSAEQKRLYKELRDEYITSFEGVELTAAMAMTRLLRLQQIVCNWFPMEEGALLGGETWRKVRPISDVNPRLEALDDILRTNPEEKAIIWARFRPDLELIQQHLGQRAVSYHGGIGNEHKAKNYKAFQQNSSVLYFVANTASAGRGLNLSAATMEVYYSNSFRLADRLQSEDRPEGDESKKQSTLIVDLEAVATVDSRIIRALKGKKDFADLINKDPKQLFMDTGEDA